MNIYACSLFAFSVGVFLIAILALVKRKDAVGIRFAIFSLAVCGWGFPHSFWVSQHYSAEVSVTLARLAHSFANFIPITWFHFVMEFLEKKEPIKCFYRINYGMAAFITLFAPTPLFISGMHAILDLQYYTTPGPLFHVYTFSFVFLVSLGFIYLIAAYRSSFGQRREQLKYFILATIIGFTSGSAMFPPTYNIPFPLYFLAAMPIYPLLMGIALIRYGLFDPHQIADIFQREKLAAIGVLATSINHELRNPLFVAKGKIESQLDGIEQKIYPSLAEEAKYSQSTLKVAHDQLSRAMDIMQRLSDFAKPSNDKHSNEHVVVKDVVNNVLHLVSNEFELQKIKVTEVPTNGISIQANRRQVEEIFFNLIINACHAMEERGGELAIRASQPNGKVIIEVADTGPGILKENQRAIFDPFYSTKGKKGSGLGLYITKQLVERNSGEISVESKLGQGTTFTIEFKGNPK